MRSSKKFMRIFYLLGWQAFIDVLISFQQERKRRIDDRLALPFHSI